MLALQILVCVIILTQIILFIYFNKRKGKILEGPGSYKKYRESGGEWSDSLCGGTWYEKGQANYNKYYTYNVCNLVLLSLMLFPVLGVFFS